LLSRRSTGSRFGLVEGLNESVSISKEGDLSKLVAAEDGHLAVKDNTLTTHVHASGEARKREGHCRREIATTHGINTNRTTDGAAETSNISFLTDTLVKVVNLDVIVDLAARRKAEAELEHRRNADLNTVLVNLDIGVIIKLLSLAEHTRAGIHDTLNKEAGLHLLAKLSAIDDTDSIRILSVKSGTSGSVAVSHFSLCPT